MNGWSETSEPVEIALVVGTRPEIIKMAPIIRELEARADAVPYIAHTDQHYDDELSAEFFDTLELPHPDIHFEVGSGSQAEQTADGLLAVESMLRDRKPDAVLAQGDTNAVLSTAVAAAKMPMRFGHVEAGIRSYDREMPEEVNRVLADSVADLAFAPTETAADNLAKEGITDQVYVTGNTVVDACRDHITIAEENSEVLDSHGLSPREYAVATIHRARNTDDRFRLQEILNTLDETSLPVLFPAHPRTVDRIEEMGFDLSGSLRVVGPLDYLDFLKALSNARVTVTDSGGVQEEASILEVPCLTVRPNTERPETVQAGVNRLVEPEELADQLESLITDEREREEMQGATDLFGRGDAAEDIVSILLSEKGTVSTCPRTT